MAEKSIHQVGNVGESFSEPFVFTPSDQHGEFIRRDADEFCRKDRIYFIPNNEVLQFYGSDFDFVQPNPGQKFHLIHFCTPPKSPADKDNE